MFGDAPVSRRYCCTHRGHEQSPADAAWCGGRHRFTRPLAQRICQLATVEHFPPLPQLLANEHGVTVSADTVMEHGALAITALCAADLNQHGQQTWNHLTLAT